MRQLVLLYLANHIVAHIPSRRIRLGFYRRFLRFDIAPRCAILLGVSFDALGRFQIGPNSVINSNCRLDNRGGLKIGSNVSISNSTTILTADHNVREAGFTYREREVVIEDHAFLGTQSLVLPGVRIGRGAVIAAGSIVTRSVEPLAIVAGNPAKVIGHRPEPALDYTLQFSPRLR